MILQYHKRTQCITKLSCILLFCKLSFIFHLLSGSHISTSPQMGQNWDRWCHTFRNKSSRNARRWLFSVPFAVFFYSSIYYIPCSCTFGDKISDPGSPHLNSSGKELRLLIVSDFGVRAIYSLPVAYKSFASLVSSLRTRTSIGWIPRTSFLSFVSPFSHNETYTDY